MLRPPGLPHLPMNAHLATAHAPGHAGTGAWACEAAAAWSAGAPEVADPEQASCELASVYSPNQLRVLGSPSAFRMRWRRDAMGPMLLSALSFDVEVELQQQASQSFYLVSTQLRGQRADRRRPRARRRRRGVGGDRFGHLPGAQAVQRRQPAAACAALARRGGCGMHPVAGAALDTSARVPADDGRRQCRAAALARTDRAAVRPRRRTATAGWRRACTGSSPSWPSSRC
jgi:hypothetical protein